MAIETTTRVMHHPHRLEARWLVGFLGLRLAGSEAVDKLWRARAGALCVAVRPPGMCPRLFRFRMISNQHEPDINHNRIHLIVVMR